MFSLCSNTTINHSEIVQYNPIVIYFVGGTYGNFLYRLLHKHINNLPQMADIFDYDNGSSHEVYKHQYTKDYYVADNKKDITINYDIEAKYLVLKKHCSPKLTYKNFFLSKQSYLNLKLCIPNRSYYVYALIQNLIKLSDLSFFENSEKININDFFTNNFENVKIYENIFDEMVSALNNSWYNIAEENNTYSIYYNDFFNKHTTYNHLVNISKRLDTKLNSSKQEIFDNIDKFVLNQKFYDSVIKYDLKNSDKSEIVNYLMTRYD